MKSTSSLSLIAGVVALAAVTGFAALNVPDGSAPAEAKTAARLPVERTSLLCPAPGLSDLSETAYAAYTPPTKGAAGAAGTAELLSSAKDGEKAHKPDEEDEKDKGKEKGKDAKDTGKDKPVVSLKEPGKPATGKASGADSPALVGTATGRLAPGWTAQQTTTVEAGDGRGILGISCTVPDTDFWFPAASTAKTREDYVHLTNPDDTAAVADIELYGPDGSLKSDVGEGITVPAGSGVRVLISTLTSKAVDDVTVHVTTRSGRVGAALRTADDETGSDWLAASAEPAGTVVLPGIPADATSVRLVAFAPGDDDADLRIKLVGKSGTITPAGHEELHIKSNMTAALDLKDLTRGQAGSLMLVPAEKNRATPVVAALRVVRGKGDKREVAYIPATGPVGARATVAGNGAKNSALALAASAAAATVEVTASAGSGGGTPVSKTYKIPAGTTLAVTPPVPTGLKGSYALTVETRSGGPVHASRTLTEKVNGIEMFTVQTLPDDRGTVEVPAARQDLSVLDD